MLSGSMDERHLRLASDRRFRLSNETSIYRPSGRDSTFDGICDKVFQMRTLFQSCVAGTGALLAMFLIASAPGFAQPAYHAPKGPDGHPNLNGIWQSINTANWDLVDHAARPGTVVADGTLSADPGGIGVVEGGEIPYLPAALEKKKKNFENRLKLDPEIRCYLPGIPRANYMPYPFQIFQSAKALFFAYQYDGGG